MSQDKKNKISDQTERWYDEEEILREMNMRRSNQVLQLRGHHLICMPLFVGEGYSDDFSRNMSDVIAHLKRTNPVVELVSEPDYVCRACPNLDQSEENKTPCNLGRVQKKDAHLLELLEFKPGYRDSYRNIVRLIRERITREIFLACCGKCSWYESGLCSYEKYLENIE